MTDEHDPALVNNGEPTRPDPTTIVAHFIVDRGLMNKGGQFLSDDEHHGKEAFIGEIQDRLRKAGYDPNSSYDMEQAKQEAYLITQTREIDRRKNSKWRKAIRDLGHLLRPSHRSQHA